MHILTSNTYGRYCVPTASLHRPAAQTLIRGDVWEPQTVDFVREHADGRDVVHAGTYFGDMLPAFADAADQLWAFEPSPENYDCACKTIEWSSLDNVSLFNCALSDMKGRANFVTERQGVQLGGASYIGAGSITVLTDLIDNLVPDDRDVSIIHLDVEGYELNAVKGAARTIERCRPILILENWDREALDRAAYMTSIGYEKSGKLHANDVWVPLQT